MEITRFNYTKNILKSVSFDPNLFCKEVEKALNILLPYEIEQLSEWLTHYTEERPELRQCQILWNK